MVSEDDRRFRECNPTKWMAVISFEVILYAHRHERSTARMAHRESSQWNSCNWTYGECSSLSSQYEGRLVNPCSYSHFARTTTLSAGKSAGEFLVEHSTIWHHERLGSNLQQSKASRRENGQCHERGYGQPPRICMYRICTILSGLTTS